MRREISSQKEALSVDEKKFKKIMKENEIEDASLNTLVLFLTIFPLCGNQSKTDDDRDLCKDIDFVLSAGV